MPNSDSKRSFEFYPLENRILLSGEGLDGGELPDVDPELVASLVSEVDADGQAIEDRANMATLNPTLAQATEATEDSRDFADSPTFDPALPLEVIFLDAGVPDTDTLINGLRDDGDQQTQWLIIELAANEDGIQQITRELDQLTGVDAVHLVSHGDGEGIVLGNSRLDLASADGYAGEIAAWAGALDADADFLIYGCDLASTDEGRALIESIGALCDCDVAASDDATGDDSHGGDWDLEYTVGVIDSEVAFNSTAQSQWEYILATYTVTNTNDSGVGSLRWAIEQSNASTTVDDTINFSITGAGVHTISLDSELPYITDDVILDATTQAGGSFTTPLIELSKSGSYSGGDRAAIVVRANNSTVSGFIVGGFADEGIEVDGSTGFGDDNIIEHNWVGLTSAGAAAGNAGDGIMITEDADRNIIRNNVVGSNSASGIVIRSTDSDHNWIYGNTVGLGIDGSTALGNGGYGIDIYGGAHTNIIGTNGDGTDDLLERNVISGNTGAGIHLVASDGNTIAGNYIGTDATGLLGRGNGSFGIELDGSASNQVGGSTVAQRNVIADNTQEGITLWNSGSTLNVIQGNYIGVDATGNAALGNHDDGIVIGGGANTNAIGGDRTAGEGNVISGQIGTNSDGIEIDNAGADNNEIYGNFIGTNQDGTAQIANARHGVVIYNGVQGTRIGGSGTGQGNIISGNAEYGIVIDGNNGTTTSGNYAQGNYIGLNQAGDAAIGNGDGGIYIFGGARSNIIGGDWNAGEGNVISGNGGTTAGIYIAGDSSDSNTIQGNRIGTNANGTAAIGNRHGIWNQDADSTVIGGDSSAGFGNLISGNGIHGIYLSDSSTSVTVAGNLIGTNASGTSAVGNDYDGVRIEGGASGNTIGGSSLANLGNLIGGNSQVGIQINSGDSNVVYGNYIGTNASGVDLGNTDEGVLIDFGSSNNLIGSITVGLGNIVAFNAGGIVTNTTATGTGNAFRGNSISSNAGLGIDLGKDGPTANDSNDSDTGSNNLQNWSVLTSVGIADDETMSFELDTTTLSSGTYTVDFYASTNLEGGQVEGERFLGTGGFVPWGNSSYANSLSGITLAAGEHVTLLITDASGNTSEFSNYAVATDSDAGGATPSDLATTSSTGGGLSINLGSGNDVYLQADDGGAIVGGLDQVTVEASFAFDSTPSGSVALLSYAEGTNDEALGLFVTGSGQLIFTANSSGTPAQFTAGSYSQLFDGNCHHVAVSWNGSPTGSGELEFYIDGVAVESFTGFQSNQSIGVGGTLVIGNDQDSVGGSFNPAQAFQGTLFDVRIFDDIRTDAEIEASYRGELPFDEPGMVANWKFDSLSPDGVTTDSVSGNNLTVKHATESGFTAGTAELSLTLDENSVAGTAVGTVYGSDAERDATIASLLASDADLTYSAETGKFYKVVGGAQFWSDAKTAAESTSLNSVNGQLVTIRSAFENELVRDLTQNTIGYDVWIGATDSNVEGEWRWVDGGSEADQFWSGDENGSPSNNAYHNFQSGQPNDAGNNEDVAHLDEATGKWSDADHDNHDYYGYAIEWDAAAVLDSTQALSYSIDSQTVAGAFAIDADTGDITVANGALLDYETNASHSITVRIEDVDGNTYDEAFTISLSDFVESNNAPTDLSSGIELNTDGGNDAYLVTSNGNAILGGLSAFTSEVRFSMDSFTNTTYLTSYATDTHSDSLRIGIHSGSELRLLINGSRVDSYAMDYRTLADGEQHTLSVTWNNTGGHWAIYVDGELVDRGTGLEDGASLNAGNGTLVYGNEQDSVDGGYDPASALSATLYDVRIWDEARSAEEISLNYQHKFDSGSLPSGLVANWQMDTIDAGGKIADVVGSNDLTIKHIGTAQFDAWSNQVGGVTASGNTLTFVDDADPTGWTSQITSATASSLGYYDDYTVAFTVDSVTNFAFFVGLGETETSVSWTDLDQGMWFSDANPGSVSVYQNGTLDTGPIALGYVAGDEFSLYVNGTSLEYKHNGTTFHTATITAGTDWYVDTSFFQDDGSFDNQADYTLSNFRVFSGSTETAGFSSGNASAQLSIDENSGNGTTVGFVVPTDPDAVNDVATDGLFQKGPSPGTGTLSYNAGQSFGDWTVERGVAAVSGSSWFEPPPSGGFATTQMAEPMAISTQITTEVGRSYQVVFDMSGEWYSAASDPRGVRVSANGVSEDFWVERDSAWSQTNMLWQQRSFTFVADSTTTNLMFDSLEASGSEGAVYGGIRVLEVPTAVSTILNNDPTLTYDSATGKFYRLSATTATWAAADAASHASTLNGVEGNLVSIRSEYENDLMRSFASGIGADLWLGATDQTTEGDFYWQNANGDDDLFWSGGAGGSAQGYENWSSGTPRNPGTGEDYVILESNDGTWIEFGDGVGRRFVTEWNASEVLSNFTFSLTNDAGGRFAIDTNTGEISVANGSLLDYEVNTSHDVTVEVNDAAGNTYSEAMTIAVNDLVESSPGTAIWRNSGDSTPDVNHWDGADFLGTGDSSSIGQLRLIEAAEAPTRDEIIVVGVDTVGFLQGEIWDGSSWTALPFSLDFSASPTEQSFDIAYESRSGDAILIWNNGDGATASVSYRVWDGTSWSAEQTFATPDAGVAQQLRLQANPTNNEMVLIVSDDNADEWAAVWDGSSWGNTVVLDAAITGDRSEISVAFESQSGNAMVVYDGINNYNDLNYQTWNGTAWSGPQTLTLPFSIGIETDAKFTTLATDPTSDRIAISVVTGGSQNQVVFAVWDGSAWGDKLLASIDSYTGNSPVAAVGFESQSGDLLATYGEVSTTLRYQTWTSGGGWSGEMNGPDLGAFASVMMIASDPLTDSQMLAVQDSDSDLHYVLWDGSSWGADHELSTNTGETNLLRPFTFVYDAALPVAPSDIVFDSESTAEQIVNDYVANGQTNPAIASFENGGFIAVWESDGQDSSDEGIYAQRFDSEGNKVGNEFRVNLETTNGEGRPSVSTFSDGGFVVAWRDVLPASHAWIEARVFDADGNPVTGEINLKPTATDGANEAYNPAVLALDSTRFIAVWNSENASVKSMEGQIFDRTGAAVSGVLGIGTLQGNHGQWAGQPEIALLGNGGFVVSWHDDDNAGTNPQSHVRFFDSSGIATSSQITLGDAQSDVATLDDGNVAVVYGKGDDIYAQVFSETGTNLISEFQINATTTGVQSEASITALVNGDFFVAYQSESGDPSGTSILGQRISSTGVSIDSEIRLNVFTSGDQSIPELTTLSTGAVQAVWASDGQDGSGQTVVTRSIATNDGTISENSSDGTFVLQATGVIDPDLGATHTFALTDDAGGRFAINSSSGIITVADGSLLDYETNTSHIVTVETTDSDGNAYSESVTINISDGIEATQSVPVAQNVDEDQVLTFSVGNGNPVSVSDSTPADSTLQVTLSVNDGVLNLSGLTGLAIVGGADGSSEVSIEGSESAINAAFEGMTFTPDGDYSGPVTLKVTTSVTADLQGHYWFDGNATDSSATGANDGSLVGDATIVNDPERGQVLSLDGSGDHVQISGMYGNPADVTLAAWVNVNAGTFADEIISLGDNVALRSTDGPNGLRFIIRGTSSWQTIDTGVNISGQGWTHVAASLDDSSGAISIYINGVLVKSDIASESIQYNLGTNTRIGENGDTLTHPFSGLIDDARVYTRALAADEIAALASDQAETSDKVAITVNPINDAPIVSTTNSTPTFTENGPAVSLFSATSIDTVESGDLIDSIVVTVASLADGSDEILVVDGQAIELTNLNSETTGSGYDVDVAVSGSSATVTITNSSGYADSALEALVDGLAYNNTSENPQGTVRLVTLFSVKDDGGGTDTTSVGIASLVTIDAVNDAATVAINTGVTVAEGGSTVITNSMLAEGDPDDSGTGVTYRLRNDFNQGALIVNGVALEKEATFTQADIDAGLVVLQSSGAEVGTGTILLAIDDGGEDGTGETNFNFVVTFTGTNDAPVASNDPSGTATNVASDPDTLGFWRLGEAAGTTATDETGSHDGTYNNVTLGATGVTGGDTAADFNGTSSYVNLGNLDVTGSGITMAAWINADSFGTGDGRIFSKSDGAFSSDHTFMLSVLDQGANNYLRLRLSAGGYTETLIANSAISMSTGQWYHVAATYDSATGAMAIYLNGEQVEFANHSLGGAVDQDPSQDVWIGGNPAGANYFDGRIDEALLMERSMSASEIAALAELAAPDYGVSENATLSVSGANGVLQNDSDADGDSLTVTEVNGNGANVGNQITLASGALLMVNSDGSFDYDPNGQFENLAAGTTATDTFTYTVSDGTQTDTATVEITIHGENDDPTITNLDGDTLSYNEGDGATVIEQGSDVVVSDIDSINFAGGTLTVEIDGGLQAAEDVLSIRNQGTAGGQIGVSGNNITFGGLLIGTFTGGAGITPLNVTFNSNASTAAITALIENITYENIGGDTPTAGSRSVTLDLTDGDGGSTTTQNLTINVSAVNDQSIADLNGSDGGGIDFSTSFTEGLGAVHITDGDATVNDPDHSSYNSFGINLTSGFADGTDEQITIGGYTFTYGVSDNVVRTVGSTDFEIDFDGTGFTIARNLSGTMPQADLTTLLRGITYDNTSGDPTVGNRFIDITPSDAGGQNGLTAISTIAVAGTNDAPVISGGPDTSNLSETDSALTDSGTLIVSDADTADTVTAHVDSVAVSGTGSTSVPGSRTNATLRSFLSVSPTAILDGTETTDTLTWNFNSGSEAFDFLADGETLILTYTVMATDDAGVPLSDSETVTVTITGTGDAPIITGGPDTSALTETDSGLSDSGTLTVSDADTSDVVTASVDSVAVSGTGSGSVPAGLTNATLESFLSVSPTTILSGAQTSNTLTWDFNSGSEAFDFLAGGETLILTYTVTATDDDGTPLSDAETVTVTITGTNDSPTGSGTLTTTNLNDNAGPTNLFSGLSVADIDASESDLSLTITLTNPAAGTISGGGFTETGPGTGIYVATGLTASAADIALDAVAFDPTDNSGPSGMFTTDIQVSVNDQSGSGEQDVLTPTTLTINRINDDPSGSGSLTTTNLNDNAGATNLFNGLSIVDVDFGENDLSLTITLTDPNAGTISGGGFTETGPGTGIYRVSGLTPSSADSALDSVTFTPTNNGGTGLTIQTDISVTVNDQGGGGEQSVLAPTTLTITRINDDPVNAGGLPTDITVAEDTASDVDLSSINLQDVDSASGHLTLTLSTGSGGTLAATAAGGVSVTGSGTGILTLSGTQADLNAFLDVASNLQFTGLLNAIGNDADSIQVDVTDNGNFGSGGGGTINLGTVNVDIGALNDDPINSGSVPTDVTALEDTASTIDFSAIDISDPDSGSAALSLTLSTSFGGILTATSGAGVTVAGSGTGVITLSGAQAALNAYLDLGTNIQYLSVLNQSGNDADLISITITDNGNFGSGGGGIILLGSTNVDITAVNDAPVAVSESFNINASEVLSIAASGVLANDGDIEFDPLTALLVSGPANGVLSLGANGSIVYTPNNGFSGTDSFFYQAFDGALSSNTVEVQIVVAAVAPPNPTTDPEPEPAPEPVEDPEPESESEEGDDDGEESAESESVPAAQTLIGGLSGNTESKKLGLTPSTSESLTTSRSLSEERLEQLAELERDFYLTQRMREIDIAPLRSLESQMLERLLQLDLEQAVVWQQWDDNRSEEEALSNVFVGNAGIATGLFSVGYVLWALRGGAFVAAVSSTLPAWRLVDPTALLGAYHASSKMAGDRVEKFLA